ncbi:hypothetical protein HOD61_02500 [archaeon]|jgi:hypothetical protein|nr:hypothetical protein [archaeon]
MKEHAPRSLDEICGGRVYSTKLLNLTYCSLTFNPNRKIECPYLSRTADENGIKLCTYSFVNNLSNYVTIPDEHIN